MLPEPTQKILVAAIGPLAAATAIVLQDFALYGAPLPVAGRSLLAVCVIALLCYVAALVAVRRSGAAAIIATVAILLAWNVKSGLPPIGIGIVVAIGIWVGSRALRIRVADPLGQLARGVRVVSLAGIAVALVSLATAGGFDHWLPDAQANAATGPPIYFLLLDGYPRADALAGWGFDNEPFLQALEARGFEVSRHSTSNYDRTQHTLPAMLNMEHLADMPGLADPPPDQRARVRLLAHLIADGGSAIDYLRTRGYWVGTIGSNVQDVTIWSAEQLGPPWRLSDYEIHLVNDTDLGRLIYRVAPDWLADAYRDDIRQAFATLVAEQGPGRFILAHVMSSHRPYVFAADGTGEPLAACFPDCSFWSVPDTGAPEALVGQVAYLNQLVLDALDQISDDAVVVLFSDHGAAISEDPGAGLGNLLAVKSPGHPHLLPDDATTIAIFPTLFNAYFGDSIAIPDSRHFTGPPHTRLVLEPWP